MNPESLELIARLITATLLGAAIGIEREIARRYAGFRTFALVSLGAALFVIAANDIAFKIFGREFADPTRIVGQIVLGIGFLGAGLIVFQQQKVINLTTAAAIWVTAAIGAVSGFGAYDIAFATTVIALFVLVVLRWIEEKLGWRENEKL
ncbi:MAG: MgtC/SapB family protein [Candidatus Paceibacteria bacterium]